MHLWPLFTFYEKHSSDLKTLMSGVASPAGSPLLMDLLKTAAAFVKRHWPHLNPNGVLDDGVSALEQAFAPDDAPPIVSNSPTA